MRHMRITLTIMLSQGMEIDSIKTKSLDVDSTTIKAMAANSARTKATGEDSTRIQAMVAIKAMAVYSTNV